MPLPRLILSAGDPGGIGPAICRAALADSSLRSVCTMRAIGLPIGHAKAAPTAEGGRASFDAVEEAIALLKSGGADALVTAPISKEAWHAAGVSFPGHTELLADRFASPDCGMVFIGPRLRIALVTIHEPLARLPAILTADRVARTIRLLAESCRGLGIASPRIAVAGLNPHAGEGGLFGDEDNRIIAPAISAARAEGIDASGPWPGDSVFVAALAGRHDGVVAMYHDQGLIPAKLIDGRRAVNVTAGLSWRGRRIVRTSPAHGTAFDIAATPGAADPTSMIEAVRLAAAMAAACPRTS